MRRHTWIVNHRSLAAAAAIYASRHIAWRKLHLAFSSALVAATAALWFATASAQSSGVTIQENTVGFCGLQGTVDSNHTGYTGSGFANADNAVGAGVSWSVSVPASGVYLLEWRFANGSTSRPGSVKVNDATVGTVGFPSTGIWTSWTTVSTTASLNAGWNSIRLEATTSAGLANIDSLTVSGGSAVQAAACDGGLTAIRIEENTTGFCRVDGTIASNHAGFGGSGFADTNNATGAGVEWKVSVPSSGNYSLEWRHANGSTASRAGSLQVNGSSVATVDFPVTGAWTNWAVVSRANIALSAGENTIRVQATTSAGLSNIDSLSVTGNSPRAADCGGSSSLSCVADPSVQRFTSIPQQFWQSPANAGTMQKISYPVHYYTNQTSGGPGDLPRQNQPITKQFNLYLPYNYREDQTYPLVVVLHGITDNEDSWIGSRSNPRPKAMLDALIAAGEIQPLIVVFPNACSSSNFNNCGFNNQAGYYYFDNELMKDLIPFLESNYSVTTSRGCRGLAGFSMGGMQTINLGMCRNLQHFASFAPFAAAPTTYRASQVAQCLAAQNQQASYPINFFYNTHGASDGTAGASHRAAIEGLNESSPYISDTNFAYHTVPGGHDYPQAMIGLFNFLRTAFPN